MRIWRWSLALAVLGSLVAAPPAAAQERGADCRAAQQLVAQLAPRESATEWVPTGWRLPPGPWVAGLLPYPYPYVPAGWRPLAVEEGRAQPPAQLEQALRRFAASACAPPAADPAIAAQYDELLILLGYLQGDVADALEQPAREILAASDSPRVRELAAAILAAVATLRRGGGP